MHTHVQPGTPGGKAGWEFVPGQYIHRNVDIEGLTFLLCTHIQPRSFIVQLIQRQLAGLLELLWGGGNAHFLGIGRQNLQHELIAADEGMLLERRPARAAGIGNRRFALSLRHVAGLAGCFSRVAGSQPFQMGCLFREQFLAQHTLVGEVGGEQIVAHSAEFRPGDVFGLHRLIAGCIPHNRCHVLIHREAPESRALSLDWFCV